MWFGVVTLFPELIQAYLTSGVIGRGVKEGALEVHTWNPRDFTEDKHRTVDDRPFGGGPGMVMKVEPLRKAISAAKQAAPSEAKVVLMSPQGKLLVQPMFEKVSKAQQPIVLICGRYEGIDERLIELEVDEEWSLGDFVLSGGELAALAAIDAIGRLVPDVLGCQASAAEDSFSEGVLDCPHYTRPENYEGHLVPKVLLSGDHKAIKDWRRAQSLTRTLKRRPDLLNEAELSAKEEAFLSTLRNAND